MEKTYAWIQIVSKNGVRASSSSFGGNIHCMGDLSIWKWLRTCARSLSHIDVSTGMICCGSAFRAAHSCFATSSRRRKKRLFSQMNMVPGHVFVVHALASAWYGLWPVENELVYGSTAW